MTTMQDKLMMWGYVLDRIPSAMPFFLKGETSCSLETAADYLGIKNIVYMNSMFNPEALRARNLPPGLGEETLSEKFFRHLKKYERVVCALEHKNYIASAEAISRFSLTHPNVKGALFDDFRVPTPGLEHTMIPPEQLRDIKAALKSRNSDLKLYLVSFDYQDMTEFVPYLEYFDVLTHWTWIPDMHYWNKYFLILQKIRGITGKPVIHGLYIHDFGIDSGKPVPMDIFQASVKKTFNYAADGLLEGVIIPQNGWFADEEHREHVQWLKEYIEWFCGTRTVR